MMYNDIFSCVESCVIHWLLETDSLQTTCGLNVSNTVQTVGVTNLYLPPNIKYSIKGSLNEVCGLHSNHILVHYYNILQEMLC